MSILIDTNVLLRSVQPSHPMHQTAVRALETLLKRKEALFLAIQNVAEFWNAATRPAANRGLGFTIEEAQKEIAKIEVFFEIVSENAASYCSLENARQRSSRERRSGSRCAACRRDEDSQHRADRHLQCA
jgi:predicted nucleic acid-binding protein